MIPVDTVVGMKNKGLSDEDIIEQLAAKGHSYQDISEALNQASIKSDVPGIPNSFSDSGQMRESAMSQPGFSSDQMPEVEVPVPSPSREPVASRPSRMVINSPPQQQFVPQTPSLSSSDIQELIESIIEDRWQQVVASVGDISLWKGRVDDDLVAVKQEVLRIEDRMSRLQASMIGKVDEYSKSIAKVGSEVVALEKVFEKIIEPLTSNVKELDRITKDLKGKKS